MQTQIKLLLKLGSMFDQSLYHLPFIQQFLYTRARLFKTNDVVSLRIVKTLIIKMAYTQIFLLKTVVLQLLKFFQQKYL